MNRPAIEICCIAAVAPHGLGLCSGVRIERRPDAALLERFSAALPA